MNDLNDIILRVEMNELKQENHEEICALRWKGVDEKLTDMKQQMNNIPENMEKTFDLKLVPVVDTVRTLKSIILWTAGTLFVGMGGIIGTIYLTAN